MRFPVALGRWLAVGRTLTASEITSAKTPTKKIAITPRATKNGVRPCPMSSIGKSAG
jgi:hypothetical protein